MANAWATLSQELASAVERAGQSVVALHARHQASSSGIVWRPGVIVTASHTIKREEEIPVTLPSGEVVKANLVGRDPGSDLAVLKAEQATAATPAGGQAQLGSLVLAVGRAADTGVNAMLSLVSAVSGQWRSWRGGLLDQFVKLDVMLFPSASGSAVVNVEGQTLGMATAGLTRYAGLMIPAAIIDRVVDEVLAKGHVSRGYLGVGLQPVPLPETLRSKHKLAQETGVILLSVQPEGPADKAGLLLGDILVALNGQNVADPDDVQIALQRAKVGEQVAVKVLRGGEPRDASVTLEERPRRGA